MKITLKDTQDLDLAVQYIKSQTDLTSIHSYVNFMPLKILSLLKILHPTTELTHYKAAYLVEDLELILINRYQILVDKTKRDLETMHKTVLGLEKNNNIDEARAVVKLMLKYKTHLGPLTIRVLKRISDDWRTFFVTTLPALKKKYT